MTDQARVGSATKRIAWIIGAMLPVAALTASGAPWKWGFALTYVAIAFGLQTLVRTTDPGVERFAHIMVLSGSAPFVIPSFFGPNLATVGFVHVGAVLVISIGAGYLLANRVRPQGQRQGAV